MCAKGLAWLPATYRKIEQIPIRSLHPQTATHATHQLTLLTLPRLLTILTGGK
jgi:hypothetical protein